MNPADKSLRLIQQRQALVNRKQKLYKDGIELMLDIDHWNRENRIHSADDPLGLQGISWVMEALKT